MVLQLALAPGKAGCTRARVPVQAAQVARAAVQTGGGVTRVGHGDLAQGGGEPDGTRAPEAGTTAGVEAAAHVAAASVLAAGAGPRVARVQVLAVLAHELGGAVAVRFSFQCRHTLSPIFTWVRIARHKTERGSNEYSKQKRE